MAGKRSPTRRLPIWVGALLIAAITLWAHVPGLSGVLVLDDVRAIALNPNIRALWPLTRSMSAPANVTLSGRPMASLSFAGNYAWAPRDARDAFAPDTSGKAPAVTERFQRNVRGYHATNILIHLAAALVLFGIVRRTLPRARLGLMDPDQAFGMALVVALLWAVHPIQTEAVTYLVQRVESLMGLFFLVTLYCAIRAVDSTRPGVWTAAAIASSAAGMATKEVMVAAPLIVVLWDLVFAGADRHVFDPRGRRVWLYGGLAATWAIVVALATSVTRTQSVGFGLHGWTPWTYLLTQSAVITHYLRLVVVPSPLVLLYDWPMARSVGDVLAPLGLVLGLFVASVVALWKRHPLGFAGTWLFLILAPTSSVLPIVTEIAAEHRMYLPLAAVMAVAVVGAWTLSRQVFAGLSDPRVRQTVAAAVVVGLVGWLGVQARARSLEYASEEGLWRSTVRADPLNARARASYGIALLGAARYAEAAGELEAAVTLDPSSVLAQKNLGAAYLGLGRIEDCIRRLEPVVASVPDDFDAHHNLGLAYAAVGEFRKAAAAERSAADIARRLGQAALAADLEARATRFQTLAKGR